MELNETADMNAELERIIRALENTPADSPRAQVNAAEQRETDAVQSALAEIVGKDEARRLTEEVDELRRRKEQERIGDASSRPTRPNYTEEDIARLEAGDLTDRSRARPDGQIVE